jgi:hypothetical protein
VFCHRGPALVVDPTSIPDGALLKASDPVEGIILFKGIVMNILETDEWALWDTLNRLISEYWAEVDHNGGRRAHEFYLPDAIYNVGTNCFEGHKNIQAFYERRRERGTTITRHIVSNVRVFHDDARCARMVGVMSLYRAEGHPPVEEARPLAMVADF